MIIDVEKTSVHGNKKGLKINHNTNTCNAYANKYMLKILQILII